MYKTPSEAVSMAKALKVKLLNIENVDVVIFPPFPDLVPVWEIIEGTNIGLGAQNLHWEDEGAFTGEVSGRMLRDAGCHYVIIGHSERRHVFGETDAEVNKKLRKALAEGLVPIFCVGEKIEERRNGQTAKVVENQLRTGLADVQISNADALVIAYEPVWAIGTGETATPEQAQEVHRFVREILADVFGAEVAANLRIQYGGSVKPGNAAELMRQEDIDGALVGGASLEAESFAEIVKAAEKLN